MPKDAHALEAAMQIGHLLSTSMKSLQPNIAHLC
jgi:hypothetical protein